MPNLLLPIRQSILAQYPNATINNRGLDFIDYSISLGRSRLTNVLGGLHYLDDGSYKEINTDWVDSDLSGNSDMVTSSGFISHSTTTGGRRFYPRRNHLDEYITFGRLQYYNGSNWINVPLPARTRVGHTLTWDAASFVIKLIHAGRFLDFTIVLKDNTAARRLRWAVSLTGLTRDGYNLLSGSTVVAYIRPLFMTDATGIRRDIVATISGGYVEFTADIVGLTYPITVDPTLVLQPDPAAGEDSFILNPPQDWSNFGTNANLAIGSVGTDIYRSILKFDLTSILAGESCLSAVLSLWNKNDYSTNTRIVDAFRVKQPWTEADVSWQHYGPIADPGTFWAGLGASDTTLDRDAAAIGSLSIAHDTALYTELQWVLNSSLVKEWWEGSFTNNGLLLQSQVESSDAWYYYSSDEPTQTAMRPKFVVDHAVGGNDSTFKTLLGAGR